MLAAILTAIEARLAAQGVTATMKTGGHYVAQNDRPPRIVWVPTRDRIGPPQKSTASTPRRLFTRQAGLVAHIWAADLEGAEELLHQVIAAAYAVAHGSLTVGDPEWIAVEASDGVKLGEVCNLPLSFAIPVTEVAPETTTATIETVAQTTTFEAP